MNYLEHSFPVQQSEEYTDDNGNTRRRDARNQQRRQVDTIKVRPGVKFQPPVSREVTAQDFKYSFERMMSHPLAPGTYFYTAVEGAEEFQAGKADEITGYKALNDHTIQINLVAPDLSFQNALGMEFCDVVAKEWVEKWGQKQVARHPLGTGPFMFDHWTQGQEIVLKKNPDYRIQGKPYLDEIRFELSVNPQTAFLKLQRGEVDILGDNLPPADTARMMADPKWKDHVYSTPLVGTIYMFLNTGIKPLDDVKVRQAVSWAVNREKLVKLLSGQAEPLYQLYPPGMPGHVTDQEWYGYDPEKAKALLAEAGYGEGFSTTLCSDNVDPNPKLVQSIQADLKAVGIEADIKLMANSTWYTFASTPGKAPMGTALWYMDFPDPIDWMTLFNKAGAVEGGMNNSFWWDQGVEDMIAEAQAMTDAEARIAKYEEVQAAILEQAPYVTLYTPRTTTMFSENVGGFYYSLVYGYGPENYWRK